MAYAYFKVLPNNEIYDKLLAVAKNNEDAKEEAQKFADKYDVGEACIYNHSGLLAGFNEHNEGFRRIKNGVTEPKSANKEVRAEFLAISKKFINRKDIASEIFKNSTNEIDCDGINLIMNSPTFYYSNDRIIVHVSENETSPFLVKFEGFGQKEQALHYLNNGGGADENSTEGGEE